MDKNKIKSLLLDFHIFFCGFLFLRVPCLVSDQNLAMVSSYWIHIYNNQVPLSICLRVSTCSGSLLHRPLMRTGTPHVDHTALNSLFSTPWVFSCLVLPRGGRSCVDNHFQYGNMYDRWVPWSWDRL